MTFSHSTAPEPTRWVLSSLHRASSALLNFLEHALLGRLRIGVPHAPRLSLLGQQQVLDAVVVAETVVQERLA
eukprot:910934-Prymnesium_polylepis.1